MLSHLDLNVADPPVSIRFWSLLLEHLEYTRHDLDDPDRCAWWVDQPDGSVFGIEVRPPRDPLVRARHERSAPGIDHLAFHVDSRAEVDAVHRLLVDAGHDVADPPAEYDYSPGYYAVAFDDPDGIRLEVVHDPSTNPSSDVAGAVKP